MSKQSKDPIQDIFDTVVDDYKGAWKDVMKNKKPDNLEIIKNKKSSLYSYDLIKLITKKITAVGVPIVLIPVYAIINHLEVANKIIKQFDLNNLQKEVVSNQSNELLQFLLGLDIDKIINLLLTGAVAGGYILIYKAIKKDVMAYYKAKFKDVKFSSDINSAPKFKESRSHRNIKNYDEITKKEFINQNAVKITLTTLITALILFLNIVLFRDLDFITNNFYLNIISYLLFLTPITAAQYIYSKWNDTKTLETIHYHFFTSQPESEWIKLKDKVALALNSKVQKIKEYHNDNSIIVVSTMKKTPNYYKLSKDNSVDIGYRLECAFKLVNLEIDIPHNGVKEDDYKTVVAFNSSKTMDILLKEKGNLLHYTKLDNISFQSNKYTDYKLVINKDMGIIDFAELIQEYKFTKEKNLICGLTRSGQIKSLNIFSNYHSIVAGTTGGGKSNQAHIACSSILLSDIDVACFFIDPKMIELKRYRDVNRVYYSSETKEMMFVLKELEKEMDRRSKLLDTDKFINNIDWWNDKNPDNKMSYVVVYIEEIGDLMDRKKDDDKENFNKEFSRLIRRIAQYGRAFGFRMFLSTQKPNADILDTKIKDSSKTRFAFATSDGSASRVILDNTKAKDLKSAGEMILQHLGKDEFLKAPLLKDNDIRKLIENIEENHNKKGKYPLGEKLVADVKNAVKMQLEKLSEGGRNVVEDVAHDNQINNDSKINKKAIIGLTTEYVIGSEDDLLGFCRQICGVEDDDERDKIELPSIAEMLKHVNIGRTKLVELKSKLTKDGYIESNKNTSYLIINKLNKNEAK